MAGELMRRAAPNVFTIDPGQDFCAVFVEALLAGHILDVDFLGDPLALADLVVHVPTRRVGRLLEAAFAEALLPRPAVLPAIRPLAEPGDQLEPSAGEDQAPHIAGPVAPKRVVRPFERRFLLLGEVERWRAMLARRRGETAPGRPNMAESLALAGALGRLIDEMAIEGVPLDRLAMAEPEGFDAALHDEYWSLTREFLRVAAEFWPARLAELGAEDEMARRLAGIEAEAARLAAEAGPKPVIVLGSTGSVRATAKLMRAVSRLPNGAVILPGLDQWLDPRQPAGAWAGIGSEAASFATRFAHPQASLKRTLAEIGIGRDEVIRLGPNDPGRDARNALVSEALRPAETAWRWRETVSACPVAVAAQGIRVVQAADEREEALAIALLMRETLETPGARVACITADRALAERVRSELARWGVVAEDSAGTRLSETAGGAFLRLLLAAAGGETVPLLAMLRHPLARFGMEAAWFRRLVDALELAVLRGRRFRAGLSLRARVENALAEPDRRPSPAAQRVAPETLDALIAFADRLDRALAPFASRADCALAALAADLAALLAEATRREDGSAGLDGTADGAAIDGLLAYLAAAGAGYSLPARDFADILKSMLAEKVLPPPGTGHPRAAILGLLEARLVPAERVILAGMSEGSFPPAAESDPFLNRAMRLALGLQPPERRIGQSAHDFQMLAGAPDLVLTRPLRKGSAPGLASRFLRRLEAFAGESAWAAMKAGGAAVLALARRLDAPGPYRPIAAPAVVPAEPRIPERLSITEVETLRRDPYALYARHLLGLAPLEPLDPPPDARDRGSLLHRALETYANAPPPDDAEAAAILLRDLGAGLLRAIADQPELHRFWWQNFLAIIPGFVAFDRAGRARAARLLTEVRAELTVPLETGETLRLVGRADRIELDATGAATLIDYKSGQPPGDRQVLAGWRPQLPISAAIIRRGGFRGIPAGTEVIEAAHLPIGGKGPVEPKPIGGGKQGLRIGEIAEQDWARLVIELTAYARGERAWRARVGPFKTGDRSDYDHLSRHLEWSRSGGLPLDGDAEEEEA